MTEEEEVGSPRIYHPGSTLLAPPSDGGGSGPSSSSFGAILDRIKSHITVRAPKRGGHKKLSVSELKKEVWWEKGQPASKKKIFIMPTKLNCAPFLYKGPYLDRA